MNHLLKHHISHPHLPHFTFHFTVFCFYDIYLLIIKRLCYPRHYPTEHIKTKQQKISPPCHTFLSVRFGRVLVFQGDWFEVLLYRIYVRLNSSLRSICSCCNSFRYSFVGISRSFCSRSYHGLSCSCLLPSSLYLFRQFHAFQMWL